MDYVWELDAALAAADQATAVILDHYARFEAIADAPAWISTAADRDAQDAILRRLVSEFPADAFCAEESTPALAEVARAGPRLWVVDPIDGTRGFARKNGEFSVMIAFLHDGGVAVGVVAEPATGRWTYAVRGGGCHVRDGGAPARRVSVTGGADLSSATLTQSHSNPAKGPTPAVQALVPARVLETYSAGIKLAQVARGDADLYVCAYDRLNDWDLAAGHILVEEAGGRVTDFDGNEIRYGRQPPIHTRGVVASNARLHGATLGRIAAPLASQDHPRTTR